MKEFWTAISNALSGENGPLYAALLAITSVTLGWRFLSNNYSAEWNSGKIFPAGSTFADADTESAVVSESSSTEE